jgi:hypothetical protein
MAVGIDDGMTQARPDRHRVQSMTDRHRGILLARAAGPERTTSYTDLVCEFHGSHVKGEAARQRSGNDANRGAMQSAAIRDHRERVQRALSGARAWERAL